MVYEPRIYRDSMNTPGLVSCEIIEEESDLYVCGDVSLRDVATEALLTQRREIKEFIVTQPVFAFAYEPYDVPDSAPRIVQTMAAAGRAAGVGPMAAVAGAIAEYVGRACLKKSRQVIIENGGDIFIATQSPRRMAVFAGGSPLSEKIILLIKPEQTPLGVCTSSGTVGHSKSFGTADAVMAISPDTALADAWATRLGNLVRTPSDVGTAIAAAQNAGGLTGAIIIKDDKLAVWGDIELEPLQ